MSFISYCDFCRVIYTNSNNNTTEYYTRLEFIRDEDVCNTCIEHVIAALNEVKEKMINRQIPENKIRLQATYYK